MIPVEQSKLHIPGTQNGNCITAALASLLELELSDMPEFEDMADCGKGTKDNKSWFRALLDWLESLEFYLLQWEEEIYLPGYFIANGPSPRGVEHSVVYKGREMVHDPHPDKSGLEKITSVWALLPLNPAQFKQGGS